MQTATYLHGLWLILFAAITVVRKVHEARAGGPRSLTGIPMSEAILMAVWSLLAAMAPFLFILSDWLAFADYPFEVPLVISLTGVVLFMCATWLLHAAHRDLGAAWTPRSAPADGGVLITDGVYAKLRHPMYAAHVLWAIAQSLILHNFVAGAGALVPLVILLGRRIPREERALLERFGNEYRDYISRTGRWLPARSSGDPTRRK